MRQWISIYMVLFFRYFEKVDLSRVYATVHEYTGQVTFYKVREKQVMFNCSPCICRNQKLKSRTNRLILLNTPLLFRSTTATSCRNRDVWSPTLRRTNLSVPSVNSSAETVSNSWQNLKKILAEKSRMRKIINFEKFNHEKRDFILFPERLPYRYRFLGNNRLCPITGI